MGFGDAMASAGPYANSLLQTDNHTNTSALNCYRLENTFFVLQYISNNSKPIQIKFATVVVSKLQITH